MDTQRRPKFHALHYNLVAAVLREEFPTGRDNDSITLTKRSTVALIALNFADRFKKDNPLFDEGKFLDQCSPDTDLYPLSELQEDK